MAEWSWVNSVSLAKGRLRWTDWRLVQPWPLQLKMRSKVA